VLRGSVRVRSLAERDGWSEIQLPDGRRARVPAGELVRAAEAAHPSPDGTPAVDLEAALGLEVARVRTVVDAREAERRPAPGGEKPAAKPAAAPLVAAGVGLAVGVAIGGVWERRRARRERSLRF
jgi:hypothetical protein